ncbi:MAG: AMIN domain-containing protein [Myxococcales bacterium]
MLALAALATAAALAAGSGRLVAVRPAGDAEASVVELVGDRPLSFTTLRLASPPRVVVDVADADPSGVAATQTVDDGTVKRIGVAQVAGTTARVVIELAGESEFDVRAAGRVLEVRVARLAPLVAKAAPPPAAPKAPALAAGSATQVVPPPAVRPDRPPTPVAPPPAERRVPLQQVAERPAQAPSAAPTTAPPPSTTAPVAAAPRAAAPSPPAPTPSPPRSAPVVVAAAEPRTIEPSGAAPIAASPAPQPPSPAPRAEAGSPAVVAQTPGPNPAPAAAAQAPPAQNAPPIVAQTPPPKAAPPAVAQTPPPKAAPPAVAQTAPPKAAPPAVAQTPPRPVPPTPPAAQPAPARATAPVAAAPKPAPQRVAQAESGASREEVERARASLPTVSIVANPPPPSARTPPNPPASAPARPPSSAPVVARAAPARTRTSITGIGFRPSAGGIVTVRSDRPLDYAVTGEGRTVVVHLKGAGIPIATNRLPLDTRFFDTPVVRVVPEPVAGGVDVRIELRGQVRYELSQASGVLTIAFDRS